MLDYSEEYKEKLKEYSPVDVEFTKKKALLWLESRNKCTLEEMKKEVCNPVGLVFTEKQEKIYDGKKEERFVCYFIYSHSRGRCYVLKMEQKLKIITVYPIGRTTLIKYKKRFKY